MAENQSQEQDQKTEQATPQRLRKAREEGQIGYSSEVLGGVIVLTCVLFFWLSGSWFFGTLRNSIADRLTWFELPIESPTMLIQLLSAETLRVGGAVLGLLIPLFIAATASGLLQTNFNFSTKPLEIRTDKLSPVEGFKRIFSSRSVVRGALSIAKATLIIVVALVVSYNQINNILNSGLGSISQLFSFLATMVLYCSLAIAGTMGLTGLIDLGFQKWKHLQDMRMSRRDLKDENKSTEGDPLIRARIKQIQAEMGRQRMLSKVPEASVVITNPTHFAVALKFDPENMDAPIVVAKGADHLAQKIIEIAKENRVAVVQRKPIARFLHAHVELNQPIPYDLYQAVAEILNFVYQSRSLV